MFTFSCWLSAESGLIWAFIGPALLVILVCKGYVKYIILDGWYYNYFGGNCLVAHMTKICKIDISMSKK